MDIARTAQALLSASLPAPTSAVAPTGSPDALATARFAAIMETEAPAPLPESPAVALPTASLGDRILNGLSGLSSDFTQSWKNVNAVLENGTSVSTSDMLKLQMGLTQLSIQYDLVGKAISRSTQNIEQLVKMQ